VLLYESPTTVTFNPAVYVDVAQQLATKVEALRSHVSQVAKNGLVDLDAVAAIARSRGFAARMHFAEAFETSRFVWTMRSERRYNGHEAETEHLQASRRDALHPRGAEVIALPS
jgi:LmbE family N-acetylglucosaminyl deacetylase